jgi:hypothetical protein
MKLTGGWGNITTYYLKQNLISGLTLFYIHTLKGGLKRESAITTTSPLFSFVVLFFFILYTTNKSTEAI